MKADNLVRIIAQEVLRQIKESKEYSSIINKTNVLILDDGSEKNYKDYEDIIVGGANIEFLDKFQCNNLDSYDYIIVPCLSNRDLSSIALGLEQSKVSSTIIDGILRGKKIIIFDEGIEYRKFEATANAAFFNMFREYEEKLCGFGIEVMARECISMVIENLGSKDESESKDSAKKLTVDKKVITEKDIYDMYDNGCKTIYLNKESIITPLAKDFIKHNRIHVICI